MIKNYYLTFLIFCCALSFGYGQISDLIISEYGEGSGNNKYVEIYNGTGASVNLSNYRIWRISNGGNWPEASISLSGTLLDGDVYIITSNLSSPAPDATILGVANITNAIANFNGDDAVGLAKDIAGTFTLIDAVGTNGPDPGSGWNVAGTTNATANRTLVRKPDVCSPNTNWTVSAGTNTTNSEWIVFPSDTWTDLGSHTETCSATNTTLQFATTSSTLTEDGLFIDVCVEITNPSPTVITEVILGLDAGSSTATNGTDYDDGAGIPAAITFPQTLTFDPALPNGNDPKCLTIFISNDDLLIEGDEIVVLNLSSPSGGDAAALGTNTQHVLTILDNDAPAFADVIITEIMYNSTGDDDEWIEICNVSGSTQVLNNYIVRYEGSDLFTFSSTGNTIADGACITVSVGSNGDGTYNNLCPFTPDYGIMAGTDDSDNLLNNASGTISLVASDGTTIIDEVTYDDGDGADGTGESLHVFNILLDNSDAGTNFWEVLNGGSPGINSLISPCTPIGPEINVEGATGFFPDIANGDITPNPFDGTDFGFSNVGTGLTNTFRIENFGGTTDLTIASVIVLSGDIADFSITALPASPIAALDSSNFDIEFNPTVAGTRTAIIQIISNDTDENPYTFTVTGEGLCVASPITALPNSGPSGTIVTVTGTNLATATASINGVPATVNNISGTVMEVTIPSGATTGNIEVFDSIGCPGFTPFTVINSQIASCEGSGGTTPTDLFISEITDSTLGGLTYVELFNGTGANINIDNYAIEVISNGSATAVPVNILDLENIVVADGDTYVIAIGRSNPIDASNYCTSITGGSGELATTTNAQFINGGINKRAFEHDVIRLLNSGTTVDEFGVYEDNDWMDSTIITGDRGFNFRRSNAATELPDPTFTLAELGNWTIIDWTGSGPGSCSGNDYSDIGLFDFSLGTPPLVNAISDLSTDCNEVTISVTASQGFAGGNLLQYVWYFFDPAQPLLGWQAIINGGIYTTNVNSPDLVISDPESVLDYQFYCEVREDDATCYKASDAIKITIDSAIWNGTWSSLPTSAKTVILNSSYDTFTQTNFSACNLIINDNVLLNIADLTYIEVINSLTVNGTNAEINIEPQGSFVQVNDTGSVSATVPANLTVNKLTAPALTANEYTYWSSPVVGETIGGALFLSNSNRRYWFDAQNFRDSNAETAGNLNVFVPGQDDIDDDADDWQRITLSSTTMQPGVGYVSTHTPGLMPFTGANGACPTVSCAVRYEFSGLFNNGEILVPIYRDDAERNDNNWNLIGNPYPSAIAINGPNGFLTQNTTSLADVTGGAITGAIFIWSQSSAPLASTNGNENINFSQSDYAIVNGSGGVAAGGDTNGDGTIDNADRPSEFIPSGQSFFVAMSDTSPAYGGSPAIETTNVVFNNAMRTTGNNDQFFRTSDDTSTDSENKMWLNLKTDNGVFNEILITYLDMATDADDGMYYDAPRNASSAVNSVLYTFIPNVDKKFAIQGKNSRSLSTDEIIPVGFYNAIAVPTIFTISISTLEGEFLTNQPVFIKDNLLNRLHNLKDSDYTFTSDTGEFNQRFEIVFRADALSIDDNQIDANALTIVELDNGDVQFKVGKQLNITNVKLIDMTGRQIYNLNGNASTEVYTLSQLSKAPYIAKVTLSNGQVINKKAIKQR